MASPDPATLADRVLAGDRRALARAITLAESRHPDARVVMARTFPHTGRAHVVGVTGPPGGGKSTLVDRIVETHRQAGRTVGVVAVDPSSPFTGGALLGDRVRLGAARATDPDVFLRSMATRGHLGGLSRATHDAVRLMDAAGKDVVLVETVGVGQGEVDVVRAADTVLVVAVPGMGDEIQNIKAGLMEIGDAFVVNKADREDADRTVAQLQAWLEHDGSSDAWIVPVLRTVATTGEGVADLVETVATHRAHLEKTGLLEKKRRDQAEFEILDVLRERVTRYALADTRKRGFEERVHAVARRRLDPYTAADEILPEHA